MTLSDLSIKNPVFAVMLSAAMIVFGYLGYRDMGISQFPEIDRAGWFTLDEARVKLRDTQAELLDRLVALVG